VFRQAGAWQELQFSRGFSASAAAERVDGNAGHKALLKQILGSRGPLNSDEIWNAVAEVRIFPGAG
jgi:hypothetical protein